MSDLINHSEYSLNQLFSSVKLCLVHGNLDIPRPPKTLVLLTSVITLVASQVPDFLSFFIEYSQTYTARNMHLHMVSWNTTNDRISTFSSLSSPTFLPSPSMTCYTILLKSFKGMRGHLRWWLIAQPSDGLIAEVLRAFLGIKENVKRYLCTARGVISLSPLSCDWRDTRGEWPLARNQRGAFKRSPSWSSPGFYSALRKMSDQCIVRGTSHYHLTNATHVTLGASGRWLGIRGGVGGTATLA